MGKIKDAKKEVPIKDAIGLLFEPVKKDGCCGKGGPECCGCGEE